MFKELVAQNLIYFHDLGIEVSFDDFGTGNTSIHTFSEISLDSIRIDRLFRKDLAVNHVHKNIVRGLKIMAKSNDIKTKAEGVETKDILEKLISIKVNRLQGDYITKLTNFQISSNWLKQHSY